MHYLFYTSVWGVLLALLFLNIVISRFLPGWANVTALLFIASLQALLILSFLMRLKYEKGLLIYIVPMVIVIILALFGLVFSDVAYRG